LQNRIHLQYFELEPPIHQTPFAEHKIGTEEGSILTIVLVNACVDDVGLAIKCDVADAEALPVAQQADKILANLATANLEAEGLVGGLDV